VSKLDRLVIVNEEPLSSRSVLAVVGLAFEAAILGSSAVIYEGEQSLALTVEALGRGLRGIISFGVCGGLDPKLRPGHCLIGDSVLADGQTYRCDSHWSDRLLSVLPNAVQGMVAGVDTPFGCIEERASFHRRTGAAIVDMESQVVARTAAANNIPFSVCRVVLNPVHRVLPPAALIQIGLGGRPDMRKIGRSLLKYPNQLPKLARLSMDTAIAVAQMRLVKRQLGPQMGFPLTQGAAAGP
jgi:adenosylhomocysteine nucleosidase